MPAETLRPRVTCWLHPSTQTCRHARTQTRRAPWFFEGYMMLLQYSTFLTPPPARPPLTTHGNACYAVGGGTGDRRRPNSVLLQPHGWRVGIVQGRAGRRPEARVSERARGRVFARTLAAHHARGVRLCFLVGPRRGCALCYRRSPYIYIYIRSSVLYLFFLTTRRWRWVLSHTLSRFRVCACFFLSWGWIFFLCLCKRPFFVFE